MTEVKQYRYSTTWCN